MSIKGGIVSILSEVAVIPPFRSVAEKLLTVAGHRFPTSRAVQSFCRHFGGKLMEHEGLDFERIVTFASGGQMYCCGVDGQIGLFSLMHYFLGTITGQTEDERPIVRLLHRLVREGDVFFDVGANLGFYSFYVGPLCGKAGSVHAFEANPRLIPHLGRSIELNWAQSNIQLNAVAVGRQSDTYLPLYDPDRIGCSSLYTHEWLNRDATVLVPVMTIDDYIRERKISRIDVMKIDIEGAEMEAFQGMEETFRVCPPRVIICELMPYENTYRPDSIEVLHRALSAANPSQIIEFLHAQGYEMFQIVEIDGRLKLPEMSVSIIESAQHVVNVAFVLTDLKYQRPEIFATD